MSEHISVPSKIFDSAVADEKEMYDMFGVKFIGNDELKRLYMQQMSLRMILLTMVQAMSMLQE